jgi:hypothetical protein
MDRRFPAKLVGFVEGCAIVALVVALLFQAFPFNGINNIAVTRVFLWIALGMCVATLLEVAIIRFPSLTAPQSALLLVLVGLLCFAGWEVSVWFKGHNTRQKPANILAHLPTANSAAPAPAVVRPEDMSDDNTSPPKTEPHWRRYENRDATDRQAAKAAIDPEPCGDRASPGCDPPKLPRITLPQRAVIRDLMKPYAGLRFILLREDPTEDSDQYADQIEAALLDAGLINSSDRNISSNGRANPAGVSLIVGSKEADAAASLSSAMRKAGLIQSSLPISQTSEPKTYQIIIAPNH